ncbi:hypothetical protein [Portibacter marinus]|uniref:hypothetical protein n=1 Tax=Portibacter marinus TaxID=2898660 RepID=UPI001F32A76D|nr:hypothetical protein [Portibacter marinus]
MKTLTYIIAMIILLACNTETQQTEASETMTEETGIDQYKPIDSDEALIATALMAAPAEFRDESTVIGYNMAGEFVTMKEGTNDLICLADDPKKEGFIAACYHKDMEPFMARGRALREEGKGAEEIFNIREEEVKSGKLKMGKEGSTLHIYYGPDSSYDPSSSEVSNAKYRYVVYMPYATAASTGLPEKPIAANHPWIMNPGTHRAHIMISPVE